MPKKTNTRDIVEQVLSVSIDQLNSIDFSKYEELARSTGTPVHWFFQPAGTEHYRLLAYISTLVTNTTILDIGTYQGSSALALAYNNSNTVVSYDLFRKPNIDDIKESNITFKTANVIQDDFSMLNKASIIMLDTEHDGLFEAELYNKLIEVGYKGLLICDDTEHPGFPAMPGFWNSITHEKYNLTSKGHWSGTGIIIFE